MLCIRSGFFLHRAPDIRGLRRRTGSLVRCAFASFFLALCSYSHFSGHTFSVLRLQSPPGGENGAQPVLMERACPRVKGGAPALLPSCPACPWQGRALRHRRTRLFLFALFPALLSFFLPSAPARLRVAFLLRLAEPSVGSACRTPAVCCAEARPLPAPAFFSPVCP